MPKPPYYRQRGGALITALALVVITSLLASGVGLLAMSHANRARRDADYAAALQLAEAGVNYELRWISTHLTTGPNAHLIGSAYTGSISGVPGTFTVFTRNTDGSTNWTLPNDATIVSTGTVGGISRTIAVDAKTSGGGTGASVFDGNFAVFAMSRLLFRNSSSAVSGRMGVNQHSQKGSGYSADVQSNGVGNANALGKPLVLAGGANLVPGNAINPNFVNNPNQIDQPSQVINYPTVDTIVASQFANGWNTLSSPSAISAQWARMRMYKTQGRTMSPSGTKALNTVSSSQTVLDNNVLKTKAEDQQWTNCIILPPGDYYFTRVTLDNNGFSGPAPILHLDPKAQSTGGTPGPVRIWIGGTDASADYIRLEIRYTATVDTEKSQLSRIFYGKNNTFGITGNGTYAGVYAVRRGTGTSATPATVVLEQSAKVYGAVIADYVTMNGGVNVWHTTGLGNTSDPQNGGSGPGPYAYSGNWREIQWLDPNNVSQTKGGAVFPDGTNK